MQVRRIDIDNIPLDMRSRAVKYDLLFTGLDYLLGLYDVNDFLVGFAGMRIVKSKAIFKVDYIDEEYRGRGYYKLLFKARFNILRELNIRIVEATCTHWSINKYLRLGFEPIKRYKTLTKVRKEL